MLGIQLQLRGKSFVSLDVSLEALLEALLEFLVKIFLLQIRPRQIM